MLLTLSQALPKLDPIHKPQPEGKQVISEGGAMYDFITEYTDNKFNQVDIVIKEELVDGIHGWIQSSTHQHSATAYPTIITLSAQTQQICITNILFNILLAYMYLSHCHLWTWILFSECECREDRACLNKFCQPLYHFVQKTSSDIKGNKCDCEKKE